MATKPKYIYVLEDETVFKDFGRKSWSNHAYETCADAFNCVISEILQMKKEKRNIKWTIDFDNCSYSKIVIRGEGMMPSYFDDDNFAVMDGVRKFTLKEILYREASK